jgi:hypothetical protein
MAAPRAWPSLSAASALRGQEHLLDGQFRRAVLLHQLPTLSAMMRRRSGSGPPGRRITPLVM